MHFCLSDHVVGKESLERLNANKNEDIKEIIRFQNYKLPSQELFKKWNLEHKQENVYYILKYRVCVCVCVCARARACTHTSTPPPYLGHHTLKVIEFVIQKW